MRIFLLLLLLFSTPSFAQQTIFNTPSADVTKEDRNFFEHESQFRAKDPDQFLNTTNYYAHGIGNNTELDATLFNWGSPASKNVSLGLGLKSAIPIANNQYQPKFIFGSMIPFSLQSKGVGNWEYGLLSAIIPQSQTRFTGGISHGTKQIFGKNVTCFTGGIEQKINEKFGLAADWYSGNHTMGILALGFNYQLPKEFAFYGGYQIPNSKKVGRNGFFFEVAKNF